MFVGKQFSSNVCRKQFSSNVCGKQFSSNFCGKHYAICSNVWNKISSVMFVGNSSAVMFVENIMQQCLEKNNSAVMFLQFAVIYMVFYRLFAAMFNQSQRVQINLPVANLNLDTSSVTESEWSVGAESGSKEQWFLQFIKQNTYNNTCYRKYQMGQGFVKYLSRIPLSPTWAWQTTVSF